MLAGTDMQCFFNQGRSVCSDLEEELLENHRCASVTTVMGDNFSGNDDEGSDLDMTCCICLENFSLETKKLKKVKVALLVQCGHFYHQKCMNNWLFTKERGQRFCPTCRTEVTYDMDIEVFPVEILIKNRKSIMRLRQKHAHRRKLKMLHGQRRDAGELVSDEYNLELTSAEWVHISLHPMENTNPIAIQLRPDHTNNEHEDRPVSPFTIITLDEIPPTFENERPATAAQPISSDFFYRLHNSISISLPSPYLTPYDNWMTLR